MSLVLPGLDDKSLINPFADDTMTMPDLMALIAENKRQELELREVTKNAVSDADLKNWTERPKANTKLVIGDARKVLRKPFKGSTKGPEWALVGKVLFPYQDLTWTPDKPICVPVERSAGTGMDETATKTVYQQPNSHNYRQFKSYQLMYRMWDERKKIEKDLQAATKEELNAALRIPPKTLKNCPVLSKVPEALRNYCLLINLPKGSAAPTKDNANRPQLYKGEDGTEESSAAYMAALLADLEVITEVCEMMAGWTHLPETKVFHAGDEISVKIPAPCLAMIPDNDCVVCIIDYAHSANVSPRIFLENGVPVYELGRVPAGVKLNAKKAVQRVDIAEFGMIVNNGIRVLQPALPLALVQFNRFAQRDYNSRFAPDPTRTWGTPASIPVVDNRMQLLLASEMRAQAEIQALATLQERAAAREKIHPAAFRLGPFAGSDNLKLVDELDPKTKQKLGQVLRLKWYLAGVQWHNGPLFFEDQNYDPGFLHLNTEVDFVFLNAMFMHDVFKFSGLSSRDTKFANMEAPLLETATGFFEAEIQRRPRSTDDKWSQLDWDENEQLVNSMLNSKPQGTEDRETWDRLEKELKEKHQPPNENHPHFKELSAFFKQFPKLVRVPKTDPVMGQFKKVITKMWNNVSFATVSAPLGKVTVFKCDFLNYLVKFAWPVAFSLLPDLEKQLARLSAGVTPGDSALADEIELLNTKLGNKGGIAKGLTADSHVYFAVGQEFLAPNDMPDKPIWDSMTDANRPKSAFLLYAVPKESIEALQNTLNNREELLNAYNALKVWKSPDEQLLIMDTDEGDTETDKMEVDEISKKRKAPSNSAADDETAPDPKKPKVAESEPEPTEPTPTPEIPDFTNVTF